MSDAVVLLVDDEQTILQALREQIRGLFGARLTCETAESVEEAREVLAELHEDEDVKVILIVSDWLMPEVRGDTFLAEVRKRYPRIVRVMLTGQADESVLERVREDELAHLLILKPWRAADLSDAVTLGLSR